MNAYVEVKDQTGTDFYFAALEFSNKKLTIKRHQGLYTVAEKKMSIDSIRNIDIIKESNESRKVYFSSGEDTFIFFDSGNGLINFFYQKLLSA